MLDVKKEDEIIEFNNLKSGEYSLHVNLMN